MEAINNNSQLGAGGASIFSSAGAKFGDNPFLSLLVAEMRSQTPLEPVDNDSFMTQMASYSSMTEQKQLNDNLLRLLDFQGALARLQGLSQSSALLGKEVTYVTGDDGKETKSGIVDSVYVDDHGAVKVKIGEEEIGLNQITGIKEAGQKKS